MPYNSVLYTCQCGYEYREPLGHQLKLSEEEPKTIIFLFRPMEKKRLYCPMCGEELWCEFQKDEEDEEAVDDDTP